MNVALLPLIIAWHPASIAPPPATRPRLSMCADQPDAEEWAELTGKLQEAVSASEALACSIEAPPPATGLDAELEILQQSAMQRMEQRLGRDPAAGGLVGARSLIDSLLGSLSAARTAMTDTTARLRETTARAERAEAAEAVSAAALAEKARLLAT